MSPDESVAFILFEIFRRFVSFRFDSFVRHRRVPLLTKLDIGLGSWSRFSPVFFSQHIVSFHHKLTSTSTVRDFLSAMVNRKTDDTQFHCTALHPFPPNIFFNFNNENFRFAPASAFGRCCWSVGDTCKYIVL